MRTSLEGRLTAELEAAYRTAGEETGYWGNYFLRSVRMHGGRATVKLLLRPRRDESFSKGLQALINAKRADLTVERVALDPKYVRLFTKTERAEAERRLRKIPRSAFPKSVPVEKLFPGDVSVDTSAGLPEGARKKVLVNAYERNPKNRAACLKAHGTRCAVCNLSFEERYGPIGKGFIHVHHVRPLGGRRRSFRPDPKKDLVPVCPNCHAMIHTESPPRSVRELQRIMAAQR